DCCLGILDENREVISFVTKEDLIKVLRFNLDNYSINLIATLTYNADININNINESELEKYLKPGLNKGIFVGKDKKDIQYLILDKSTFTNANEKYLREEYEKNIPCKIKKALKYCYTAADKISLPIYLIGGIVRDIIISTKNSNIVSFENHFTGVEKSRNGCEQQASEAFCNSFQYFFDVDITVEENAIEFSKFLQKEYPEICKVKEIHEEFKTSKVIFLIDDENIELDIASTRKESYFKPASLPSIDEIGCNIYDDLVRRDFTINSMALSLNQNSFCKLIDPLNGYEDILDEKIRILHPVSFIDDPTRIIRAIKFSTRFNYNLEQATKNLLETCIDSNLFNNLAGERIKSEIKQTFNLNKIESFNMFIAEKAYNLIDINIPENIVDLSEKCFNLVLKYYNLLTSKDFIWLIYLGILLINFENEKIIDISNKLYLSGMETEILLGTKSLINRSNSIKTAKTNFELYELLEGYLTESVLIALTCTDDPVIEEKINLFETELKDIKIYTTGKDLIEAGLVPGPVFGEIFRELLQTKVDGKISSKEDEEEYIKTFSAQKYNN
ncbi:MAG: hypothetical protein PHC34_13055, partial [Candidatus Gastranaerophilales bacterium]|nr:hypothetical protein [Candidatus Gastranaerophilales bacterium]